jgi:hypothetical protein
MINAVQNTALQRTLGADAVSSRSAAVRGDFPDRVERVGRAGRGTVYDNSLFTMLDTIARLGGRPADDAPVRAPAVGPTPANQAYSETWHGVVRPLLERAREAQGRRLDAAPGTWQFDDFKGGEIYSGVPVLPPVPAPTIESVMGNYLFDRAGGANLPAQVVDAPEQIAEVMRTPGRFDRQTVAAVKGWLAENVMSPTRLTQGELPPGPSYTAPPARPVNLAAELAANAVTGPGRYGEVRIAAVPNYGALVQQAQAQGVRLRAEAGEPPVADYEARVAAKLLAEQALARARRM